MPIKIETVLICDDVRREVSGKEIIIGVYGGSITVPRYPGTMVATIWLEFDAVEHGDHKLELKIETPSGNPPIEISIDYSVDNSGPMSLFVPRLPLHFERDGDIVISIKLDEQNWEIVKKKSILRGAFPPSA